MFADRSPPPSLHPIISRRPFEWIPTRSLRKPSTRITGWREPRFPPISRKLSSPTYLPSSRNNPCSPLHSVSTTFKHPDPETVAAAPEGFYDTAWQANEPSRDIYSREGQPTLTRAEKVLEGVIGHPTLVYPSGLNAFYALLLHVNPDVVAMGTKEGPGYVSAFSAALLHAQR